VCVGGRGEGVVLDELRAMSEFGGFVVNDARVCLRCWGGRGIHRIDRWSVFGGLESMALVCVIAVEGRAWNSAKWLELSGLSGFGS
jgi:hypothetical protein